MVQIVCAQCRKEFNVKPARLKKGQVKYCSRKCYADAARGVPLKPELRRKCLNCEKEFLPAYNQRNTKGWGKFCSMDCRVEYSLVKYTCDYCGKFFERQGYKFKKDSKKHFCSIECRNKANRGLNYNPNKKDYRDGAYRKLSKQLREEAKRCEGCNKVVPFENYRTHHKIPPWLFDNRKEAHARENLEVVCIKCHRKKHRKTMQYLFKEFRKFCKDNPELKQGIIKNWNCE